MQRHVPGTLSRPPDLVLEFVPSVSGLRICEPFELDLESGTVRDRDGQVFDWH